MPKKAVKIPAARKSQGVRWTLQVSADAGETSGRAPKTRTKRIAAKPRVKQARRESEKKSSHTPTGSRASLTRGRHIAAITVGVMLVIVALAITRDPSQRALASVHAQPAAAVSSATLTPPAAETQPHQTPALRPASSAQVVTTTYIERPQPAAAKTRQLEASPLAAKPSVSAGILAPAPAPVPVATGENEPAVRNASAESSPTVSSANVAAEPLGRAPVTISGCLEGTTEGDRFRLTDTEGAGAPKARGWRSGFLKKRAAAVELIDLRDASSLRKLVGHRVLATGVLDSKELRVRSITQAGSMCD